MAALGSIRKRGVTLIIIIGLGLFAFIAEEMFRSCEATSNERRQQVGEVLGEKISVQDFQSLVDEYQEVIKITQGRDNFTDEELNSLKDQVWNQYVSNTIIQKEAEELGLTVTDEELQNILREGTNPMLAQTPFVNQQTGRFDASMLTKFLAEYKKLNGAENPQMAEQYQRIYTYWQFIEKTLRQQTLAMKYQSLMANCLLTNPASVQMAIDGQNIESSILLASAPYASVNDNEVKVEDSDLKSKYDEQKARFEQYVESRDIKYVDFQVLPSKADRDALMGRMKEAANGLQNGEDVATVVRKGQSLIPYTGVAVTRNALPRDIAARIDSMAVGQTSQPFETVSDNTLNVVKFISKTQLPDSVEYRQINVGGQTVEEANKRADSIYNALVAGADFEVLAKKYGQTGQKQWLTSNMYEQSTSFDSDTKNYLEVLSTTAEGTIKNVNFAQGNAIVQVTSRRAMVDKYLLAVVKHTIDFSKATYSAAYNKFSQFVSESQTLEALEKNAAKYGYQVLERKDMFNSEHFVAGIRGTRDALKWVFEAKEGNLSPLYECGNNDHLMVVAITKIHPVGFRALDDVKDILKSEVMKDKKFAKLSEKYGAVKSIADAKAKGMQIDTVNQITFSAPAFIQATGSSEPALSGAVVATKQGKFSAHLVKGSAGAYLFEVLKQAERPNALKNVKSTEAQLQQQAMQVVMSRFMNELYTKAKVVDHRYLFF
ncbi:MAG: SurA N-terminal domain-containing protein [Prevotella sp.]|nr:SurA N-terminal domain-containing protein [Prevotella sp.]MDD6737702.1 SurA N-terminal domain-containing protein [Prevotella sp.]